jgi:hypothetical protein
MGGQGHSGPGTGTSGSAATVVQQPGAVVSVVPNATDSAEEARLRSSLDELDGLSAADLHARFPTAFEASPSYTRATVGGLDVIQGSSLALTESELLTLERQGFVLSGRKQYPTFAYGYQALYAEDLPLYVSADSILSAVHLSYDDILKALEQQLLIDELTQLLAGMHQKLAQQAGAGAAPAETRDADLFLAVARSLLSGRVVPPLAGADPGEIQKLFSLATAGQGVASVDLFGVVRQDEDFSQFTPRGHYTDSPELTTYFRAMMWLGRIDLRLLEAQPDGSLLFRRPQLEIMLQLRELIGSDLLPHYQRVDRTVAAFVGEPDYMVLSEVDQLLADLGISGRGGLGAFSDQQLAQAIIDGGYGAQRIASHIMMAPPRAGTLPLSRSFALLGQRYVVDSHVFSNVVYDRINSGGESPEERMMPDPLDAGFAALGNDQAAALLGEQLNRFEKTGYPGALTKMRLLVDEHPAEFWQENLYGLWLGALRTLSPRATSSAAAADSLFPVARSEAWGRRLLSAQLASWAELRHDTILYAKQSYTGGVTCDFPDAYVDPYPEFFAAIADYATRGTTLIEALDLGASQLATSITTYFAMLADVAGRLREMAEHERSGAELTPEMMAFINEAVMIQQGCGSADFQAGWYRRLFYNPQVAVELSPTIADVHTDPNEGAVLHVATGVPRLMVVVSEGCSGPRAYAGLASAYREVVTSGFERIDDPTWETQFMGHTEVPWMVDLVAP